MSVDEIITIVMLCLALFVQGSAAIWALLLYNAKDGFRVSWIAYTVALMLMSVRRAVTLLSWWAGNHELNAMVELMALAISVAMLACVAETMRVVHSDAHNEKQLDVARQRAMIALSHVESLRLSANGVKTERALEKLSDIAIRLELIAGLDPGQHPAGQEANHDPERED